MATTNRTRSPSPTPTSLDPRHPPKRPLRDRVQAKPPAWPGTLATDAKVIPVDLIRADPDQPRKTFDDAATLRLALSMLERGQLQPIRVRKADGEYLILIGERRWRAAMKAGIKELTCIVHDGPLDADQIRVIQLVENCCREDLAPVDQARAMRALLDAKEWTQEKLADELGVHQGTVSRSLGLLDLPIAVRDLVVSGELSQGVALALDRLEDKALVAKLAADAVAFRWTVKEASNAAYGRGAPPLSDEPVHPQPPWTLPLPPPAPTAPNYAPRIIVDPPEPRTIAAIERPKVQRAFDFHEASNGYEIHVEAGGVGVVDDAQLLMALREYTAKVEQRYLKR